MNTIAGIFSPPLLAVICGVAVAAAAVLFVLSRQGDGGTLDLRVPLSWADPIEIRLILYLLLAAACGAGGLILRLFVGSTSPGSVIGWFLLIMVVLGFVFAMTFYYAAAGSLLQAALGSRGRPPFFFSPWLGFIDGIVMDSGDVFARILLTPAPVRHGPRRRTREDYRTDYDAPYEDRPLRRDRADGAFGGRARRPAIDFDQAYEEEPMRRVERADPAPGRRIRRPATDYDPSYEEQPMRPRVRADAPPAGRTRGPATDFERAYEEQLLRRRRRAEATASGAATERVSGEYREIDDDYFPQDEAQTEPRQSRGVRRGQPRDILRERLDRAIEDYEASLTPAQLQKLRIMQSLLESMREFS